MNRSRDSIDPARAISPNGPAHESAHGMLVSVLLVALGARMTSAQTITNGAETAGTQLANTTNAYTFNATSGDSITLRMGATTFNPRIVLFNPSGVAIGSAGSGISGAIDASMSAVQATNTGTFTIAASSIVAGGNGAYTLRLAHIPGAFVVSPGDEGGAIASGALNAGTNSLGDLDLWSFDANAGDSIVVRVGATTFNPWIRLFGPNGALVGTGGNGTSGYVDVDLAVSATNSGTFTVVSSSVGIGGTGSYKLALAKAPGAISVLPGDEGGPLTNGWLHTGSLSGGDLDVWSFDANAGDNVLLRMGAASYNPWIRLYGPNGTLLGSAGSGVSGDHDVELAAAATNSGTFTVVAGSITVNGTGNYTLTLAKSPGAIFVAPGDEGGPLTNGWPHSGTLSAGDLDLWSFSASAGDNVVLRMGATNYNPLIRLYGPNGVLIGTAGNGTSGYADVDLPVSITNSGAFTVVAGSVHDSGTGNYTLTLAKAPGAITVAPGDEGGPMTNGWKHSGSLRSGDLDLWSFDANAGENLVVRMGATNFNPWIRLYGPAGALVRTAGSGTLGNVDVEVSLQATNSGTFTVVAGSVTVAGAGAYLLNFAKSPGAFAVAPADEGGAMLNGAKYTGTLDLGDLDAWSFAANSGDTLVLRIAATNFNPQIRLYGPNGAPVGTAGNGTLGNKDINLSVVATNSGIFNLVANSFTTAGNGYYLLNLVRIPATFVVSPGDEAGTLVSAISQDGVIDQGDLDPWRFGVCRSETIVLSCQKLAGTNFSPRLRLYGTDGALLVTAVNASLTTLNYAPTNSGIYTVLVDGGNVGDTGDYRLTGNGLSDELNLCKPLVSGTNLNLAGVGGPANATFVLLATTNVASPAAQWTPIVTNQFDAYGVFDYTTLYDSTVRYRFFRLHVP